MEVTEAVSTVCCQGLRGKAFILFRPSAFWISLGPRCATEMMWSSVRWFAHWVGHAAHLYLDSSDRPGPDAWRGHDELVVELLFCTSSRGQFKRSQGTASATGKMSLNSALGLLMYSCRFCS